MIEKPAKVKKRQKLFLRVLMMIVRAKERIAEVISKHCSSWARDNGHDIKKSVHHFGRWKREAK